MKAPSAETHYGVRDASTTDPEDVNLTDYGIGMRAFEDARQAATMLPLPGRRLDHVWFQVTVSECYPVMPDDPGPVT